MQVLSEILLLRVFNQFFEVKWKTSASIKTDEVSYLSMWLVETLSTPLTKPIEFGMHFPSPSECYKWLSQPKCPQIGKILYNLLEFSIIFLEMALLPPSNNIVHKHWNCIRNVEKWPKFFGYGTNGNTQLNRFTEIVVNNV